MNAVPNKSLDVRAKQRLSYRVVFLPFACAVAVSPHVNSSVGSLRIHKSVELNVSLASKTEAHIEGSRRRREPNESFNRTRNNVAFYLLC